MTIMNLTNLVVQMLNTFEINSAHLIISSLPLYLKKTLQIFNDPTHDCLVSQPKQMTDITVNYYNTNNIRNEQA